MAWEKSSPRLIAAFDALVPPPPAERRKMFGYPCAFVNGLLFMGLWQEELMLRLPEGEHAALQRLGGKPFEPMAGRPMREYVSVPSDLIYNPARLGPWVDKSFAYARSLPPKTSGKKKPAKGAKATPAKPAKRAVAAAKPGRTKTAKPKVAKGATGARKAPSGAVRGAAKAKPGKARGKR